jgi:hypothetical protein
MIKTVRGMECLVSRLGEIIGGSERESNLDGPDYSACCKLQLDRRLIGGISTQTLRFSPPCGFGLGFERAVQYITGMGNIRDVIPYPRAPSSQISSTTAGGSCPPLFFYFFVLIFTCIFTIILIVILLGTHCLSMAHTTN